MPHRVGADGRRCWEETIGAGILVLAFGFLIAIQVVDTTNPENYQQVANVPLWLAVVMAVTSAYFLLFGSSTPHRARLLSILLAGWFATAYLNPLEQTGENYAKLAAVLIGLVLASAAASPAVSGWIVTLAGAVFVWLNGLAIAMALASQGALMPGAARWWSQEHGWVPIPDPVSSPAISPVDWLATVRLPASTTGYIEVGLASNPNGTGNALVLAVAFSLPFAVWWFGVTRHRRRRAMAGVAVAVLGLLIPGILMLAILDARSALIAALASLLVWAVPRRLLEMRIARIAAALTPFVVLAPVAISALGNLSLTRRSCVWADWRAAVGGSPAWGIGAPGGFAGDSCGSYWWRHTHNEVLQAWSISGIGGALTAALTLGWLGWLAVKHYRTDGRGLLAVMAASTVIMGTEILSLAEDWRWMGLATLLVIAGRSLRLSGAARTSLPGDRPPRLSAQRVRR